MHYYQFNIGDYSSHTKGLSLIEDLAYRRLIDEYYLAEHAFNGCSTDVARLIGLRDNLQEVEYVLNRYFIKDGDSWHHGRIDSDIADYHQKQEKRSNAGKKSAEARQKSTDVEQVLNECSSSVELTKNQEPITNNQEPIDKKIIAQQVAEPEAPKKKKAEKTQLDYSVWPQLPDQQILSDWISMRKAKRAPLSQTVLDAFGGEFKNAATFGYSVNDCLRTAIASGWTGFKFSWMQNQNLRGQQNGNNSQPKPSLIDRFIQNNYAGTGFENDNRPMGSDDRIIRGEVVEPVRGDTGRIGAMEADLIGDFKEAGIGGFE